MVLLYSEGATISSFVRHSEIFKSPPPKNPAELKMDFFSTLSGCLLCLFFFSFRAATLFKRVPDVIKNERAKGDSASSSPTQKVIRAVHQIHFVD